MNSENNKKAAEKETNSVATTVNNSVETTTSDKNEDKKKKKQELNPCDRICRQYRQIFRDEKALELEKDINALKQQSLRRAIAKKKTGDYDRDAFMQDIKVRVNLLLAAPHFKDWCDRQQPKLDVFAAATNVVMAGYMEIRRILFDDMIKYHSSFNLVGYPDWNTPMFTREELGIVKANEATPSPAEENQAA